MSKRTKGITLKLVCLILSALLTLAFAHRSSKISIGEQIFITSLAASTVLLVLVLCSGARRELWKKRQMRWYYLRAALSIAAMTTWAYTAKSLGANEATLLSYLIPISTLSIAALCRLERMHKATAVGMIICLLAIFLSLRGDPIRGTVINVIIGLFTSICWGGYDVICKKQSSSENFLVQGLIVFALSGLIMAPFVGASAIAAPSDEIIFALLLGMLRVGIVVTVFLSYQNLSVNSLMIMSYLRLPIMLTLNYAIFNDLPLFQIVFAAIVIVVTNMIVISYNRKIDKKIA